MVREILPSGPSSSRGRAGACAGSRLPPRGMSTPRGKALRRTWGRAVLEADESRAISLARTIFAAPFDADAGPLTVHVRGTNFQLAVWRALLRIPTGAVTTYGRLAADVCSPRAARATGNAVGSNPISFLIPCHRVIRATGESGNYGGGRSRKRCMLGWEASRQTAAAT